MMSKPLHPSRLLQSAGIAFLLALSAHFASAQTTVSTTPVGYLSLPITPSVDGTTPANTVVSVPLSATPVFAGAIASVDSSSAFSIASGTWTTNQFTATPFLVQVMTGSSTGRTFQITGNTASQLTVNNNGYNLTQMMSVGDTFQVVPANTFSSLFGTTNVQFQTGNTAATADNLYLWNGQAWTVYYNNGTHWQSASSLKTQDNAVILPNMPIFINRLGTSALTLTFMGVVPSTALATDIPGPGFTPVANRFPVDTTVAAVGIQSLPGWQAGSTANNAGDNMYIWNGAAWDVYYYTGTDWYKASSLKVQDNTVVPAGSAVWTLRQSTASGTSSTLTQSLPYSF